MTKICESKPFEIIDEGSEDNEIYASNDDKENEVPEKKKKKKQIKDSKNNLLKQDYADLINFTRINEDVEQDYKEA